MAILPQVIRDAWEDRNGPAVLATINKEGVPNVIYVGNVGIFGKDKYRVVAVVSRQHRAQPLTRLCNGSVEALAQFEGECREFCAVSFAFIRTRCCH